MSLATRSLVDDYLRRTPTSAQMFARACEVFPSGVTHDSRYLRPHPIYVERAAGSRKWDVDGNEYVDYAGGHGALLLGHNHPEVTAAVARQLPLGSHFGAGHELEVRWGELVQQLVPSAQRVRFTASGTEATLLALRLARAHTGRAKVVRFLGHFHGWHDHMAFGVYSHFDGSPSVGVLPELARNVVLAPPGDFDATQALLTDDVAAVIIEPTGASWGQVPVMPDFLAALREWTQQRGIVLVFDEVISGFRVSPGGAQAELGITPDLTTLAKILAGGMPGGAIAGRRDIMEALQFVVAKPAATGSASASTSGATGSASVPREKISHHGTFNANPISAAAGIATLELLADGRSCRQASEYAARLREALRRVLRDEGVDWSVYGSYSSFHIFTNPEHLDVTADDIDAGRVDYRVIKSAPRDTVMQLRVGMLAHGVELFGWPGGPTSAVHTDDDLQRTADAFRETVRRMR